MIKKKCVLHGDGRHNTEECFTLKKLREKGIRMIDKVEKELEQNTSSEVENEVELNKKTGIYSLFSNVLMENPFKIKARIGDKYFPTLLDTGADISLVHLNFLPKDFVIKTQRKYDQSFKSASGGHINIVGTVKNLPVYIDNKLFLIEAFVTKDKPEYIIIGVNILLRHPDLIKKIINDSHPTNTINKIDMKINNLSQTFNQENVIATFLKKYESVFNSEISQDRLCTSIRHEINLHEGRPFREYNSRIPVHWDEEINMEIKKLQKNGIIKESTSPFCSRIVPVRKTDGTLRLCIDFRTLNSHTIKDSYPLPRIDEILDSLAGATYFSILDMTSGYSQIAIREEDSHKTAFAYKNGLYEFTRMPFGLCNAPGTFQRAMNTIFKEILGVFVIPYLDDIIIFSKTEAEHIQHLEIVFGKIKAANLTLNKNKCSFLKKEIKILGNIVSQRIIKPDPQKIHAIKNYNKPKNIRELRAFLGLCNYVRHFVKKFAQISQPLTDLLKGESKRSVKIIIWNQNIENAFSKLKNCILTSTYRHQPDFTKKFILTTDASEKAIGACLSQQDEEGNENLIYTFSKIMDKAQMNYSVTDKELLAVVKSVEYFRHYLVGKTFELRTDHKALEFLKSAKHTSGRFLRWSLKLQEYDYECVYIKGEENKADGLSRYVNSCCTSQKTKDKRITIHKNDEKNLIISEYHIKTGHGSPNNMKFLIREKYFWEGMFNEIENFVKGCITCQKNGGERIQTKNKIIRTERPNQLWQCDLIGRLTSHDGSNKFIFVAVDHYSKWVEAKIINRKTGIEIKEAIEDLIIKKHGIPETLLTDNGLEFRNSHITDLSKKYKFTIQNNSPGNHKTMGLVERTNQTLFHKLQKLSNYGEDPWEDYLQAANDAVNISFNRSINTSPFAFKYGKHPLLNIDKRLRVTVNKKDISNLHQQKDKLFESYALRDIQKGKRRCSADFKIGENVLVFNKEMRSKLESKWEDGYKIEGIVSEDAFLVKRGKKIYRVNKKQIKRDFRERGVS